MNTAKPRTAQRRPADRIAPAGLIAPQGIPPDLALLSIRDITGALAVSETFVRDLISAGQFPQPDFRYGPRCVRWSARSVAAWLEANTRDGRCA